MRYIISSAFATLAATLPALAEAPRVVTDIHPVHSLVAQVMGDLGKPELLLERGASEHDFQLRPSQAAGLVEADLIVWIGPELTPWLGRALDGLGEDAAKLGLLTVPGTTTQEFSEDGAHTGHDHDHDHDHDHEETAKAADEHDHSHDGLDPHAWLDPANAQVWLTAIAAELGRIDPANAATYTANAKAATKEIAALDSELATTLAPLKGKPIVVYHDAYGYLAAHYGLDIFGSIALGDATAPGAARLAELRDGVAAGTPVCLFPEAQYDTALVEQIAEGTGARIGGALDPNGSMQDPGPGAYAALLRSLAQTMVDCVQTS
ncbi:zinc ABC transporter substrate-binding protein [Fuscovulum ytuae]|uniref:High-affinity zinc uptake system protein ZnuA n=1 Tax=Fuscovulum ytuae TaxID=3042299 RepID=A0ABY8Q1S7_9RHOB|nr:zinc ABC transporter substrate-binding protein [Fuscovulum sp. YMD61]WGV14686.1 zinc ABC transporter substrate-binding protein [Fuscovulum sp. YMD61]